MSKLKSSKPLVQISYLVIDTDTGLIPLSSKGI